MESKVLRLVLPLPPSVNHMYLHSRFGGKRIRTAKAKEWFDTAEKIVRTEIVKQGWQPTIEKKVVLDVLRCSQTAEGVTLITQPRLYAICWSTLVPMMMIGLHWLVT